VDDATTFKVVVFYLGKGGDMPSIYAVDSTSDEDWERNVRLPSSDLISSFLWVCLNDCHDYRPIIGASLFITIMQKIQFLECR